MLISFSKPPFDSLHLHKFSTFFLHSVPLISSPLGVGIPTLIHFFPAGSYFSFPPWVFPFNYYVYSTQNNISAKLLTSTHFQEPLGSKHTPQEPELHSYQHFDLSGPIFQAGVYGKDFPNVGKRGSHN